MAGPENIGNVVGLIKSLTPPEKTYILWAHILDEDFPDVVTIKRYDFVLEDWVEIGGGLPSQVTIETAVADINSRVVNNEEVTIKWYDNSTGAMVDVDVHVTGTIWEAVIADQTFMWINGEIIEGTAAELFFDKYNSCVFDDGDFTINASRYSAEQGATFIYIQGNELGDTKVVTSKQDEDGQTITKDDFSGGTQTDAKEFKINLTALDTNEPDAVIVFKNISVDHEVHAWIKGNTVNINDTSFANLASGIELLPDIGNPEYYAETKFELVFTPGATPYTFGDHFSIITQDGSQKSIANIMGSLITGSGSTGAKQITIVGQHANYIDSTPAPFHEATPCNNVSNPGFALISFDGSTVPGGGGDGVLTITPYYRLRRYNP